MKFILRSAIKAGVSSVGLQWLSESWSEVKIEGNRGPELKRYGLLSRGPGQAKSEYE